MTLTTTYHFEGFDMTAIGLALMIACYFPTATAKTDAVRAPFALGFIVGLAMTVVGVLAFVWRTMP